MHCFKTRPFKLVYANSIDAYIPELWANESVAILVENMVIGNLVHKDFSPMIASFGDIVHTRKPAEFTAVRKVNADSVTVQDASAADIQVPLDQHLHTSFMIKDGEESKSFKQLRDEYLEPAIVSIAQAVDKILLGCSHEFYTNGEGIAGGLTSSNIKQYILETRKRMNINKAYMQGRNLILTPTTESTALNLDLFISADKIGDEGTAMREASLGRKLGFDIFMCQNAPSTTGDIPVTAQTALVDLSAGYNIGDTVIHCDTAGDQFAVGQWISIGGSIHQVTALGTLATQDIDVTINPGLRVAVADDDPVTIGDTGLVNDAGDYAAGYNKEITVDGIVGTIPVGALVSFATVGTPNVILSGVYSVIATTGATNTTGITLNRSLDTAITNDDVVLFGPPAEHNFAFHRNALTLVSRPLAPAPAGLAISSTASMGGVGVRVTITYNGSQQGVLVTVDLLCGVKVLDTPLGAVLIG